MGDVPGQGRFSNARTLAQRLLAGAALLNLAAAHADPAVFDLAGPTIELEVTRGGTTLPAAEVPNLMVGDRVWMKADLASGQSTHYLMVAALLRGATNPPQSKWFHRCETWTGACAREGMTLTVPKEAQQLLVFLAPVTGGDFSTLVNAVRGRPGAFVRTSQDLNQATLDHSRLEAYLAAIRTLGDTDPSQIKEAAPLLARSLAIKVDEKCLEKIGVAQARCLMQGQESLILNDGHSASIAQVLTSGPASDLAMAAGSAPQVHSGYYGPFIGSIFDIARILDSLHTAQYQYIPALPSASGRQLKLSLNTPPSFHDPMSVLVVSLPAVEVPRPPPLHAVDAKQVQCAKKDSLVLPVEGAPLVFSTAYAHDLRFTVHVKDGSSIDLPVRADAVHGGMAVDTSALHNMSADEPLTGSLHGYWGFDAYEGPSFQLVDARPQSWQLAGDDAAGLVVGREDTVHVHAASVSCVRSIELKDSAGRQLKVDWKSPKPDELEMRLPLQSVTPGELTLIISQYGGHQPQTLPLHAFAEAGHLDTFALHSGDIQGVLTGSRLDQVEKVVLASVEFTPGKLVTTGGHDELAMPALDGEAAKALAQADTAKARVILKDGRNVDVRASVGAPRPSAALIAKSAQAARPAEADNIQLANKEELPQDAQLVFSLRAKAPTAFTYNVKIEVATDDGSSSTLLGVGSGGLTLQNSQVAVATLDPTKAFGTSAFGPLRFRLLSDGVAGDWLPLATLVRLPGLKSIECPVAAESPCVLSGANLFLLDSVSANPAFTQAVSIPDGFTGQTVPIPHPTAGRLYVKLRDDPSVVSVAVLDVRTAAADDATHGA